MNTPTITFQSITFSDDTEIELDGTDVVVLVGPNNAGKSVALRELEEHVGDTLNSKIVKSVVRRTTGTQVDFATFVNEHVKVSTRGSSRIYSGNRFSFSTNQSIESLWPNSMNSLRPLFCTQIPTKTRITDSDPVNAIDVLDEPATHPIHMLYSDDQLECRISGYFRRAFGEDLVVFHGGGKSIPLLVGQRPEMALGEQRTSRVHCERLRKFMVPLNEQGDGMRSFASVVMHLLAPTSPSILLLDEPEAFLHPSQARLLGEIIATEKSSGSQLFVATHSPDVLHGLITVAPDHLHVLRMQRDGNVNRVKELDKSLVKEISSDPLMKYSSVVSGVFHERVIICEADADCLFYSSILDLPEVHGERQPDVLFVHGNGKHRMGRLAKVLTALDVPVDVVADIDIVDDLKVLKELVEALGGDWVAMESAATAVKKDIEQHKPPLTVPDIRERVREILDRGPSEDESPEGLSSSIGEIFREASPWNAIKRAGEAALSAGQATLHFLKLQAMCRDMGLWIVPVGEMERFCKSIGGHGPKWIQQVIEQRKLANDPELKDARDFVRQIWSSKPH